MDSKMEMCFSIEAEEYTQTPATRKVIRPTQTIAAPKDEQKTKRAMQIKMMSNEALLREYNRYLDMGTVVSDLRAEGQRRGIIAPLKIDGTPEAQKSASLAARARREGWEEEYEDGYIPGWAKK